MESRVTGLTDKPRFGSGSKFRLDGRQKKSRKQRIPRGAEDSSYFRGRLAFQLFSSGQSSLLIPNEENIMWIPKMRQYVLTAFLKAVRGSKFLFTKILGKVGNFCRSEAVKNS